METRSALTIGGLNGNDNGDTTGMDANTQARFIQKPEGMTIQLHQITTTIDNMVNQYGYVASDVNKKYICNDQNQYFSGYEVSKSSCSSRIVNDFGSSVMNNNDIEVIEGKRCGKNEVKCGKQDDAHKVFVEMSMNNSLKKYEDDEIEEHSVKDSGNEGVAREYNDGESKKYETSKLDEMLFVDMEEAVVVDVLARRSVEKIKEVLVMKETKIAQPETDKGVGEDTEMVDEIKRLNTEENKKQVRREDAIQRSQLVVGNKVQKVQTMKLNNSIEVPDPASDHLYHLITQPVMDLEPDPVLENRGVGVSDLDYSVLDHSVIGVWLISNGRGGNEFVDGANGSEGSLVLSSNFRSLANGLERNLLKANKEGGIIYVLVHAFNMVNSSEMNIKTSANVGRETQCQTLLQVTKKEPTFDQLMFDTWKWLKREKEIDRWQWLKRDKMVGIQWKVNLRKWKFKMWSWPNRKKRRWEELSVKLVSCWKEDLYVRWFVQWLDYSRQVMYLKLQPQRKEHSKLFGVFDDESGDKFSISILIEILWIAQDGEGLNEWNGQMVFVVAQWSHSYADKAMYPGFDQEEAIEDAI